MSCPCDLTSSPDAQDIAPGLSRLPRAIGDFASFRRALLTGIPAHTALNGWRAREQDDLGVMMLEFWAYIADIVALYDEVYANEAYLRTAVRDESVNRLIGLLGYQPRPATAASASLAIVAEGAGAIALPSGAAFLSGAFDDEAPQDFETESEVTIDAGANRWTVRAPRYTSLGQGQGAGDYTETYLDCEPNSIDLDTGDIVLVRAPGHVSGVHEVTEINDDTYADGSSYTRVTFDTALDLPNSTLVTAVEVLKPTQHTGLWVDDPYESYILIALERLQPGIRPNDRMLLSKGDDHRWFKVTTNAPGSRTVRPLELIEQETSGDTVTIVIPAVTTQTTLIGLDSHVNNENRFPDSSDWSLSGDAAEITVSYGMVRAVRVTTQPKMEIWPDESLDLVARTDGTIDLPADPQTSRQFILQDANGTAYVIKGALNADTRQFEFTETATWDTSLVPPVTIYGNIINVCRGITVSSEVLGSGDASQSGQTFTLKKSPLTYLPDTSGVTERGYRSTVTIWVDGLQWTELEDFVIAGPTDAIYVLRQNEDDETQAMFGDGVNGRRLPTGSGNVIATYRQGAGAAAPPSGSITQLVSKISGITSVTNPLAAGGGDDAESGDDIRENGPSAALLLGRIVSLADVHAVTTAYPGITAAATDWRWHEQRQTAVVQVYCITDGADLDGLRSKIRNLSEPSLQVDVAEAEAVSMRLSLTLEIHSDYREEDVLPEVRANLTDDETGMLAAANIGIGKPLFRSRIYAEVMQSAGVVAVTELLIDGSAFSDLGRAPEPGFWFDVATGGLVLNGQETDGDG